MVKELLDSEILLKKNNKCLFSNLYLHLTKMTIITVIAVTKIIVIIMKITIIVLAMLVITK